MIDDDDAFEYFTPARGLLLSEHQEQDLFSYVHKKWKWLPLLNISDFKNLPINKLVRLRGMVQDVLRPELYYEEFIAYDTRLNEPMFKTMKYCESLPCGPYEVFRPDDPMNVVKERQRFIVTIGPRLNQWVHSMERDNSIPFGCVPGNLTVENRKSQKRSIEEMDAGECSSGVSERKKLCITQPQNPQLFSCPKQSLSLQNPQPECFYVTLYIGADQLKILDLVEFVGFLSVCDTAPSQSADEPMDVQTDYQQPSTVFRFHCVAFKKIKHYFPVLEQSLGLYRFYQLKSDLHFALTQLMMGDELAAEYLIYHLISKIYERSGEMPLGKFSLNISQIPPTVTQFVRCVYEFIELLVPTSHYLAMTAENMNSLPFIPRKDYESDRPVSGLLQVSNNTHLLLDETKLEPGQLMESGNAAIAALKMAIYYQKVPYNCQHYSFDFDCDIAFLILSERKSCLPSDFEIQLQPSEACFSVYEETQVERKALLEDSLDDIRHYLCKARYFEAFDFHEPVMTLVQNDFVRMQQSDSISPDDMHQLLVLSRLIALSDGKICLDATSWYKACELEQKRKSRFN